jgi:hypothetical protein
MLTCQWHVVQSPSVLWLTVHGRPLNYRKKFFDVPHILPYVEVILHPSTPKPVCFGSFSGFNFAHCRLAYQPPTSSTFLSQQASHHQSDSSTFLSEQISTSAKRTSRWFLLTLQWAHLSVPFLYPLLFLPATPASPALLRVEEVLRAVLLGLSRRADPGLTVVPHGRRRGGASRMCCGSHPCLPRLHHSPSSRSPAAG